MLSFKTLLTIFLLFMPKLCRNYWSGMKFQNILPIIISSVSFWVIYQISLFLMFSLFCYFLAVKSDFKSRWNLLHILLTWPFDAQSQDPEFDYLFFLWQSTVKVVLFLDFCFFVFTCICNTFSHLFVLNVRMKLD